MTLHACQHLRSFEHISKQALCAETLPIYFCPALDINCRVHCNGTWIQGFCGLVAAVTLAAAAAARRSTAHYTEARFVCWPIAFWKPSAPLSSTSHFLPLSPSVCFVVVCNFLCLMHHSSLPPAPTIPRLRPTSLISSAGPGREGRALSLPVCAEPSHTELI